MAAKKYMPKKKKNDTINNKSNKSNKSNTSKKQNVSKPKKSVKPVKSESKPKGSPYSSKGQKPMTMPQSPFQGPKPKPLRPSDGVHRNAPWASAGGKRYPSQDGISPFAKQVSAEQSVVQPTKKAVEQKKNTKAIAVSESKAAEGKDTKVSGNKDTRREENKSKKLNKDKEVKGKESKDNDKGKGKNDTKGEQVDKSKDKEGKEKKGDLFSDILKGVGHFAKSGADAVLKGNKFVGNAIKKIDDVVHWKRNFALKVGTSILAEQSDKLLQDKVTTMKDEDTIKEDVADMYSAVIGAGKSTITNQKELAKISKEFGTTFGKADHSGERNITPEQAAVLAAHVYGIDQSMKGESVNIHEHEFGGSIDDKTIPEEIKQVEGMENFVLEEVFENYEKGSGDLKIGAYYQILEDGEKEYYFVNMGTHSKTGWKNNFENIDGNSIDMADSIKRAEEFKAAHPKSKITMIGHSKGGGEAAANAVATDTDAMIFNPNTPFLSEYNLSEQTKNYTGDMSMYVAKGEALDTALNVVGYRGVDKKEINYVEPKYKSGLIGGYNPNDAPVNNIKNVASYAGENFKENMKNNHGLDSILYGLQKSKGATRNE